MSATAQTVGSPAKKPGLFQRMGNFWARVTEGQQVDDLMKQLAADARAGYGFYGRDLDREQLQAMPGWKRPFHIFKQVALAMLFKLSPARRVLLLAALLLIFVFKQWAGIGDLMLVALFLLELADKVTMKRDLEIAREIQSWLIPSSPPIVPGVDIAFSTRPQNSVAGDYYDAFYPNELVIVDGVAADGVAPPNDSKLMVVVADVVGKSVPAALLMATLQASLRTIAGEGAPLADLVVRLNHYASAHSLNGQRFTTAVLAEYEPQTRRFTYVNAGHNAPVLRRANGSLEILDTGGLPLGIHAGAVYQTATLELQPGDALILFTDGVVEAFNEKNEEFGNTRWNSTIQTLPRINAQDSLRYLMAPVDEFVGLTRQSDDITCLVFRCV
jgi:sigma-B regulation protein RsbU (phosphoserine phosphatase)